MKVTIEKVQFEQSIQGELACLEINHNIMHFVSIQSENLKIQNQSEQGKLYVIDLDHPEKVTVLDIPNLTKDETIVESWSLNSEKGGIILSTSLGKKFYYNYKYSSESIVSLKKISKKQNFDINTIESIEDDVLLIGTRQSKLYKYNLKEDSILKLHQWGKDIVDGLSYIDGTLWTIVGSTITIFKDLEKIDDLKTTTQPAIVEIFEKCSSKTQKLQHKRFIKDMNTNNFGWVTKSGVVFGSLSDHPTDAKVLLNVELPFPLEEDSKHFISDIFLSEYHIVMLTSTRQLIIVNQLNNKVVFQEDINLSANEPLRGFKVDYSKNTFWLYSNKNVFEIVIKDEYTNVWKIFLKSHNYEELLKIKEFPKYQKEMVYKKYGDYLLENKDYLNASENYSHTNSDISYVNWKLLQTNDINAWQNFLTKRLQNFEMNKMQQKVYTSLILWNYIQLQSDDRTIRDFLIKNLSKLDKNMTYEILKYQTTTSNLLFYANLIKDYRVVLNHWINLENWYEASKMLLLLNETKYIYQYATVLLCNDPESTIQTWMKLSTTVEIEPEKLLKPILTFNSNCYLKVIGMENYGLNYLKWCVNNEKFIESEYLRNTGSKYKLKFITPLIHNTILYIMIIDSKSSDESTIIEYMRRHSNKFDSNFILNLSLKFSRIETAINLYSDLSLLEEAVDLAIKYRMMDTAKRIASVSKSSSYNGMTNADGGKNINGNNNDNKNFLDLEKVSRAGLSLLSEDESNEEIVLRRPLWIKISKVLLLDPETRKGGKDIKQVIIDLILESNGILTIKDLLPLFDSMTTIANIKDEFIKSLQEHADSMKVISEEITSLVDIKKNILEQIELLEKSYVKITPGTTCESCKTFLQSKKFYCFPCGHNFHINCLISTILKGADFMLNSKIQELQKKRKSNWVQELDEIISAKCPYCSDISINNIDEPLLWSKNFDENLLTL